MKKNLLICLIALFATAFSGFAQTQEKTSIRGRVLDNETMEPMMGAAVVAPKYNIGTTVDSKGEFELKNVPKDKDLELKITYIGYKDYTRTLDCSIKVNSINVGVVKMVVKKEIAQEAVVEGVAAIATQDGDTTRFNTAAIKVNPDAYAEDLVKKLPGVEVENGKITAQGEEVKKFYVDGKRTFGNNSQAIMQTLPANLVKRIDMYDEQDEQSKFAGYNDGQTERAFNFVTYGGVGGKGAHFITAQGGIGTDEDEETRYGASLRGGMFREWGNAMLNANVNNINKSVFSSGDLFSSESESTVSFGRNMYGRGGRRGGFGSSGKQKLNSVGATFNTQNKNNLKFETTYMMDNSESTSESESLSNYFQTNNSPAKETSSTSLNQNENTNHRVNLNLEGNLNKRNRIQVRSSINLQNNDSYSFSDSYNYQHEYKGTKADTMNRSWSENFNNREGYRAEISGEWMHRFAKEGRTFSLGFSANLNDQENDATRAGKTLINRAMGNHLENGAINWNTVSNDQYTDNDTKNNSFRVRAALSEQTGRYSRLVLNYVFNMNNSENNRWVYADETMKVLYDSLTNVSSSDVTNHQLGLGYSYNNGTNAINIGLNIEHNKQVKDQEYPSSTLEELRHLKRSYFSWRPNIDYRYFLNRKRYLNFQYSGSTQVPSIENLQAVVNNTNPLSISVGNPKLKQGYSHSLRVYYNSSSFKENKTSYTYFSLNASNTSNSVANNTFTINDEESLAKMNALLREYGDYELTMDESRGIRFSQPMNLNGRWSLNFSGGHSFFVPVIKCNLNLGVNYTYNRMPSFYESFKNVSNSHNMSAKVTLTSNISEKIDFTVSSNTGYTFAKNTTKTDSKYFTETLNGSVKIIFLKRMTFSSNIAYNYYDNSSAESYSDDYALWNAALGVKVFKNNRGEFQISANDILKQNTSYTHTINDTYISDTRSNILGRYFMVSFTYRFSSMDKFMGGGRGPMPGGPGMGGGMGRGMGRGGWR
ncbi:MAG: TonB-dependent receptor [Rikenellaceae bacterium]|nr:TonB-dependent receptor [Rikenellaceae bacterium]